ncbi:MAG: methylmalonyl-CoA epimerase [Halobacteriota archaeon]|nr:methylmalonyl-CoA epimerase [Halobacteriota archaeon]
MVEKIDHIGIAVKNLDDALKLYTDAFGLSLGGVEVVEDQKVRIAFIMVGESRIELLESTDPEGPIAKHIEKRGEGIQHIALGVSNIEETLKMMKEKEIRLIDEKPRLGAGEAKIAFLHPKATNGVLLELCERE